MHPLVKHATRELKLINMTVDSEDAENASITRQLINTANEFAREERDDFATRYLLSMMNKLLLQIPLTPLTGEDDEWEEITDGRTIPRVFRNRRYPKVFKQANVFDGQAYNIDGKLFVTNGNVGRTPESAVPIEFPYTPKTEYVQLEDAPKEKSLIARL